MILSNCCINKEKDYHISDVVESTDPIIYHYLHKETKDVESDEMDGGFDSTDSSGSDGGRSD